MATNNFWGVKNGIYFKPATLPATGNLGDITFDSAANAFKYWNGSAWSTLYPTSTVADNYIINSNFKIWQRTSAAQTGLGGSVSYHADRFAWAAGTITGVVKSEQVAASVFTGSSNLPKNCQLAVRYEVTTAQASLGAAATAGPWYNMEGYDWESMLSSGGLASGVTLSFYVAATVTGTYAVEFSTATSDNRYVATYTVNSANTWQRVIVTLSSSAVTTGIGSGTWDYGNGTGLRIRFWLAAGTTSQGGTQNAWTGSTPNIPATHVNFLGTLANRWAITGLMFNTGPVADYAPRGTTTSDELQMCRRYYEKTYDTTTAVGTATAASQLNGFGPVAYGSQPNIARVSSSPNNQIFRQISSNSILGGNLEMDGSGRLNNGSTQGSIDPNSTLYADMQISTTFNVWIQFRYKVSKRASPTVTIYNPNTGATGTMYNSSGSVNAQTDSGGTESVFITNNGSARSGTGYAVHVVADAEL